MLLVLLNWIIIFFTTFPTGRLVNRLINNESNLVQNIIVGLIVNWILINTLAFYLPINSRVLIGLYVLNLLLVGVEFSFYKKILISIRKYIFSKQVFVIFLASLVLAIYSTASSKINDDGLYYTQTIKWLREFGFVHGISNLHVSLGLSSSWHLLQSLYIFSDSIYTNDLNGFVLLIYTIHFVSRILNKSSTIFSLTQYFLVLLLSVPFLSAPNPDFPIIVFTAIALDLFMLNENYKVIILLACFSITIKISSILLFLSGLYCLFKNRNHLWKEPIFIIVIFLVLSLHISKNIYQTAYPFFPLKVLSIKQFDWKTPEPVVDYFLHGIKSWSYSDQYKPAAVENEYQKDFITEFYSLINRGGTKGLINKFLFVITLLSLFVFAKERSKNRISLTELTLILIGAFNLFIWFLFAPQYRFILPVFVFFSALIVFYTLRSKTKVNNNMLYYSIIGVFFLLFFLNVIGINVTIGSTSKEIGQIDKLNVERLMFPAKQYYFEEMDSILVNNKFYYHPKKNRYCWNSKLPCMSSGYEKVIWNDFQLRILQRTNNLQDGFLLVNQ